MAKYSDLVTAPYAPVRGVNYNIAGSVYGNGYLDLINRKNVHFTQQGKANHTITIRNLRVASVFYGEIKGISVPTGSYFPPTYSTSAVVSSLTLTNPTNAKLLMDVMIYGRSGISSWSITPDITSTVTRYLRLALYRKSDKKLMVDNGFSPILNEFRSFYFSDTIPANGSVVYELLGWKSDNDFVLQGHYSVQAFGEMM